MTRSGIRETRRRRRPKGKTRRAVEPVPESLARGQILVESLRDALMAASEAAAIAAPIPPPEVLHVIVETAAAVLQSEAGALLLLDEERQELVFQVAVGGRAEQVKQFRVPLGHGIAGYVAATGHPIAIADAQSDPRFASEIGQMIGYTPSAILCVPLYLGEQIIGVLELLNKTSGASFSPQDMELLGRFGRLAAFAIDQARLHHDLRHLFRSLLRESLGDGPVAEPARRFADAAAGHVEHTNALRLAGLVHELNRRGDSAQRLGEEILGAVVRYVQSREHSA